MIGKMQDMVTAAVVVSAADNRGTRFAADTKVSEQANNGNAAVQSGSQPDDTEQINVSPDSKQINVSPDSKQANADQQENEQNSGNNLTHGFVSEMTRELNELMSKLSCDLEFQYHKEVGVMSVKMVDKNTKEVIKEFPPEEMVEGMIKAQEWLGAFLDKNA